MNEMSHIYKTLNILCVEDDTKVLEIYKEMFSIIFADVFFATDGIEGIERFKNEKIDIILTDYQMPNCNGIEMSRKIREYDATIPIIMVTALENIEMLREALDIHITSFLKKPFNSKSLFSVFNLAVKSVVADRIIYKEQSEKILYRDYQESLTFNKEKIITKNDLSESKKLFHFNCEVIYKPRDILSGDSYVLRKVDRDGYCLFLVDGMGKGISASVTAMMCSAFVDFEITKCLEDGEKFQLQKVIEELLRFMKNNLLDDEIISASFLHFHKENSLLEYAVFSMPPILYIASQEQKVHKLPSNNTPIANYTQNFQIDTLEYSQISKMLISSDGLNENSTSDGQNSYGKYLKDDFLQSSTVEELEKLRETKIGVQEDDVSYIMLY